MLPGCGIKRGGDGRPGRLMVLAFDGLDPRIVDELMRAGRLPNFARVARIGSYSRLATSNPAQTPVAFSNIISGADPGTHQIYDFIHRDPKIMVPYLSTSGIEGGDGISIPPWGEWRIPLFGGGQTVLLRRGNSFWEELVKHGVDTTVYYIPSNYPPKSVAGKGRFRCISGMGTPDLLGTYGEFTLFTPDAPLLGRSVGGGRFEHMQMFANVATGELAGPTDHLHKPSERRRAKALKVKFDVVRDPIHAVAKIEIAGHTLLLKEGEWSDFIPIDFQSQIAGSAALGAVGAPVSLRGIVRFYLKSVRPKFELYVSPINIDPIAPIMPISVPDDFAAQLARRHARFYTTGIPEDTKSLSRGALTEDQFISQSNLVMHELTDQYYDALAHFESGCLFFYFGWSDLMQHMFWRDRDPQHPGRDPEQGDQFAKVVDEVYMRMDKIVGRAMEKLDDDDTLIILSDHGFSSFRRGFNLNTWLADNGYVTLGRSNEKGGAELLRDAVWNKTKAYGLGLNALYVNTLGRERSGMVAQGDRRSLLEEIRDGLMRVRDEDGSEVIKRIDLVEDIYPGADPNIAPDMLIGYDDGYRASWDTVLGTMAKPWIEDNLDRWSGTHLIAPELVPGIFLSNRKVVAENPTVSDIAPTILDVFDVPKPASMTGRSVFARA